jgi:hypothetical protein
MKAKPLVQQLYELNAARKSLERQETTIKNKLARRLSPGEREEVGHFYVTLAARPACLVPEHTRKPCLVWEVGIK